MIDFAAKRGCPVCIRGWKMIAVAGTVAVVVALLMLRWHAGAPGEVMPSDHEPPRDS